MVISSYRINISKFRYNIITFHQILDFEIIHNSLFYLRNFPPFSNIILPIYMPSIQK